MSIHMISLITYTLTIVAYIVIYIYILVFFKNNKTQIYAENKYRLTFFFFLGTLFLVFKASVYAFDKFTTVFMIVDDEDKTYLNIIVYILIYISEMIAFSFIILVTLKSNTSESSNKGFDDQNNEQVETLMNS
jgi:amino acid transporter